MKPTRCKICGSLNSGRATACELCGEALRPLRGEVLEPLIMGGLSDEEAGSDEQEDWLEQMRREADALSSGDEPSEVSEAAEPKALRPSPESEDLAQGDIPDWLQRIRDKQAEEIEAESVPGKPVTDEQRRDKSALGEPALRAGLGPGLPTGEVPREKPPAPEPSEELPIWLKEAGSAPEPKGDVLPHVPALIREPEEAPAGKEPELGLPDWLGEIESLEEPIEEELVGPAAGPGPDLAPATLPSWLEAMRPVDTFRSVLEIEAEEDQSVESVGPLAGLRGVLLAEPVVAMPRTSTVGSMQLDITERQYAQAELLHKMVEEEQREVPDVPRRKVRPELFRWGIAALVLLAVALPVFAGAPTFAVPRLAPQELAPLRDLVNQLPVDRPALLVFDYEPGYSGELEAVSGPFLDHVMNRGLPLATMSTRPTGSPLAVTVVNSYAGRYGYSSGQTLVHLGYLSGGPTAVQLFAISPRSAILKGFGLPVGMPADVWDTPLLQSVRNLSDFSMVAVITGGTESARVWAEQAGSRMGTTPLVMVLSAGAEPLVRPYFEAKEQFPGERRVDGILSGLPAAVSYELQNTRPGVALERWNPFGSGMLAAELILLAGAGYGIANWWLGRREQ